MRLLEIYRNYQDKKVSEVVRLKSEMANAVYNTYIDKKVRDSRRAGAPTKPAQQGLFRTIGAAEPPS